MTAHPGWKIGTLYLPTAPGERSRVRLSVRRITWRKPRAIRVVFTQGTVVRVWLGPLLFIAMIDDFRPATDTGATDGHE